LRFSGVLARKARGADGCHHLGLALFNLALDSKLPGCDSVSGMAVSRYALPTINGRNGSNAVEAFDAVGRLGGVERYIIGAQSSARRAAALT
jgi:hypothetical protein